jgi:hypothetical protein
VNDPRDPVPLAPLVHERSEHLRKRREALLRLQQMLEAYWFDLTEEGRPLAEDILERVIKEAALKGRPSSDAVRGLICSHAVRAIESRPSRRTQARKPATSSRIYVPRAGAQQRAPERFPRDASPLFASPQDQWAQSASGCGALYNQVRNDKEGISARGINLRALGV